MLFTEAEAEKIICGESIASDNRGNCAGSHCMHWRWGESDVETRYTQWRHTENEPPAPEGDGWEKRGDPARDGSYGNYMMRQLWWRPQNERRLGYCGKSGRPEYDK